MKKNWSEIARLPVSLSEEEGNLGKLSGVFLNPETGQIIAFMVGFSRVLNPVDVVKWQEDGVLISEKDALMDPFESHRLNQFGFLRAFFNSKFVKTKSGKSYGRVRDFTLDLQDDRLVSFESSRKFLFFEWNKRLFTWKDIDNITKKTIILVDDFEEAKAINMKDPVPSI